MKAPLRLAAFVTISVVALAALPTRAADAVLPPAKPRIALDVDGAWNLRSATDANGRREVVTAHVERKRVVRLVYPALIEPR